MNAVTEKSVAFRDWYNRNALMVVGVILAMTMASLIIGVVGTFVNAGQNADRAADNKVRDEANAALLACFNEYAEAQSSGSTVIRAKTVLKDVATAERDDALNAEGIAFQRLVQHILAQDVTPEDVQMLAETLDARSHAAANLKRAQAALDKARRDNPVPDPPSEFCAD